MKIASKSTCTACSACINICSHHALEMKIDKDGYFYVLPIKEKCFECGLCSKVCPVVNPIKKSSCSSKFYACINRNIQFRKFSASGGVFSAIAEVILNRGGIVYGASISGLDIVHERVVSITELPQILGSKYQQGNLTDVYKQVKDDLLHGYEVLFSGVPCQVAGLKSFLRNTPQNKLYTVDVICGGFSTMLPMINLKNTGLYKAIHSFRNKDNGWKSTSFQYDLRLIRSDNTIEDLGSDNLVLKSFSSKLLKRDSCCSCRFTSPNRQSDVTIGDFWGDRRFLQFHHEGLSVMAIHNPDVLSLIDNCNFEKYSVSIDEVTRQNPHYYWTRYPLIKHLISRKIVLWAIKNNKYNVTNYCLDNNSIVGIFIRLYLKVVSIIFMQHKYRKIVKDCKF